MTNNEEKQQLQLSNVFLRCTLSEAGINNDYQINLPSHILKKVGWKLNQKIVVRIIKDNWYRDDCIIIEKTKEHVVCKQDAHVDTKRIIK